MKTKQTGIKDLNKAKARLVDWYWQQWRAVVKTTTVFGDNIFKATQSSFLKRNI